MEFIESQLCYSGVYRYRYTEFGITEMGSITFNPLYYFCDSEYQIEFKSFLIRAEEKKTLETNILHLDISTYLYLSNLIKTTEVVR